MTSDVAHLYTIGVFAVVRDGEGRVLLVRQNYAGRLWTLPGGRLEAGEHPVEGIVRETFEEARVAIRVIGLIGTYVMPFRGNLVLSFAAVPERVEPWAPDAEIADIGWFAPDALPEPLGPFSRVRLADALAGRTGVLRTHGDEAAGLLPPHLPEIA